MSAFSNNSFPPPDLPGRNHFWELGMIRMHYTVLIFLEVNGLSRAIKRGIESKRALPFRIARAHLWWIERSNHWQQLFQSNLFCPLDLVWACRLHLFSKIQWLKSHIYYTKCKRRALRVFKYRTWAIFNFSYEPGINYELFQRPSFLSNHWLG